MLTGFLPFYEKNPGQLFEKIKHAQYNWDGCPPVSDNAKDFVAKFLTVDPKLRPSASEALQHVWLKQFSSNPTSPLGHSRSDPRNARKTESGNSQKTRYQRRKSISADRPPPFDREGSNSNNSSGLGSKANSSAAAANSNNTNNAINNSNNTTNSTSINTKRSSQSEAKRSSTDKSKKNSHGRRCTIV